MPIASKSKQFLEMKRKANQSRQLSVGETNRIRKAINSKMKVVKQISKIQEHQAKLEMSKVVLTF